MERTWSPPILGAIRQICGSQYHKPLTANGRQINATLPKLTIWALLTVSPAAKTACEMQHLPILKKWIADLTLEPAAQKA